MPLLTYRSMIELPHMGDCNFLGVSPDLNIYVEEIYTEDAWIAQHALTLDGMILESIDEAYGKNANLTPLTIPDGSIKAQAGWQTIKTLNFTGARHRGLREAERITDVVRPFSIEEEMTLVKRLGLNVMPPLLLGLAESYVLAEAELERPYHYVVCRRVRVAFALSNAKTGDDGQSYDYDTHVFYLAHRFDRRNEEISLSEAFQSLPDADLYRPMDCLITQNHLLIADGGGDTRNNRIHIWNIERDYSLSISLPST